MKSRAGAAAQTMQLDMGQRLAHVSHDGAEIHPQPTGAHDGAEIHLHPVLDPTLEQNNSQRRS